MGARGSTTRAACAAGSLALLLAACTAGTVPDPAPPGQDPLAMVGRWKLQGANDAAGRPIAAALPGGRAVHALAFDGAALSVEGGCNRIGGRYRIDAQGALVVPEMHSTLMACADRALMDADAAVIGLLQGRSRWRIAESHPEQLHMDHAGGQRSRWVADRTAR
jgi:heat shock protein HslJ